jgi:hypothetical protein
MARRGRGPCRGGRAGLAGSAPRRGPGRDTPAPQGAAPRRPGGGPGAAREPYAYAIRIPIPLTGRTGVRAQRFDETSNETQFRSLRGNGGSIRNVPNLVSDRMDSVKRSSPLLLPLNSGSPIRTGCFALFRAGFCFWLSPIGDAKIEYRYRFVGEVRSASSARRSEYRIKDKVFSCIRGYWFVYAIHDAIAISLTS